MQTPKSKDNFTSAAAFSGFVVGCCSPALMIASIWIVETHLAVPLPYVRGLSFALAYYLAMGLILGLGWAMLFAVALPLARRIIRSTVAPWPTLAYITLAALATQAVTILAIDLIITSQHLQPSIDNSVGNYLAFGVGIALYVVPALTTAILVLNERSRPVDGPAQRHSILR